MSFKNDVLDLLRSILKEQNATRHAILHQTNLLERGKLPPFINIHDQPTEYPKEVAPAPKTITWQEAVKVLADACGNVDGIDCALDKCPMRGWCSYARKGKAPQYWVVPLYEKEAADE